ncbi:hypothetical protein ACV34S_34715, partial [Pseudomonas aeruginosa]
MGLRHLELGRNVAMAVRYIATLRPSSRWRRPMPASSNACSKENEQPMAKATKSASQNAPMSFTSTGSWP